MAYLAEGTQEGVELGLEANATEVGLRDGHLT